MKSVDFQAWLGGEKKKSLQGTTRTCRTYTFSNLHLAINRWTLQFLSKLQMIRKCSDVSRLLLFSRKGSARKWDKKHGVKTHARSAWLQSILMAPRTHKAIYISSINGFLYDKQTVVKFGIKKKCARRTPMNARNNWYVHYPLTQHCS